MAGIYAIVVGIEGYQQKNIKGVQFAHNDANAIATVLQERLDVPKENLKLWTDHQATYARLQSELKNDVLNLASDDKFFFFFAGHGFWAPRGGNRLTAWDTHPSNLYGTTVSMEEVLLGPLRQSRCRQSAIFIDACSSELFEESSSSRDLISNMEINEFLEFVKNTRYSAAFFASSPEQKSYSSPVLKHGVWTHHLVRALKGEEDGAVFNDRFVTGQSLQDYLLYAVPKFVRENFANISAIQTPFAKIDQNGTFILTEVPSRARGTEQPLLAVRFENGIFAGQTSEPYRYFSDFDHRSNSEPAKVSLSASNWAKRLCKEQVAAELQSVAVKSKRLLKVRSSQIHKEEDLGTGSVDTAYFRYEVCADQNEQRPTEVLIRREITLRNWELPDDFDEIFEEEIDTFMIPTPGANERYIELLDAIEDYESESDISSEGDQTKGTIRVTLPNGTWVFLDTRNERLTISFIGAFDCSAIIQGLQHDFLQFLIGAPPELR